MSNIKAIKNLTVYQDFDHSNEILVNPQIHVQPDVCIIRSIHYCGKYDDVPAVYLIKSDISEDIIGSFAVHNRPEQPEKPIIDPNNPPDPVDQLYSTVNFSPQTMILMTKLINTNSQIKFTFFMVDAGDQKIFPIDHQLSGVFSMTMDFITYK